MECFFEKTYQFPCQASEFFLTISFVNVELNYVFYMYVYHKNFFQFNYLLIKAYALEERKNLNHNFS